MTKTGKRSALFIVAIFFAFYSFSLAQVGKGSQAYTISRVIDGDTFKLSNGQTLKLAGINAPEIHDVTKLSQEAKRFGKEIWQYHTLGGEAHKFVQGMIKRADDQIELESETQSFDEDGNLLAYVFVPAKVGENTFLDWRLFSQKDGRYKMLLNGALIHMGFAGVVSPDVKYQNLFQNLEKEAKANKRGIWK